VDLKVNKNTMEDWFNFCQYICRKALQSQDIHKIGDTKKIVKINKSKFNKKSITKKYDTKDNGFLVEWNKVIWTTCS
jgi:hypothetical protein